MRAAATLGRRQVTLAGVTGAALLATGCTDAARDRPGLPETPDDPDLEVVSGALRAEEAVLALIEATRRRHPALRAPLREALAVHRAHTRLLTGAVEDASSGDPAAPPRSSRPPRRRVAPRPGGAMTALVLAERSLHRSHLATALRADSGVLARAVAGMAAAAAQQEVVLARMGVPGGRSAGGAGS